MPDKAFSCLIEFHLSRRGMFIVRWRAVRAFVTAQGPDPDQDPVVSSILRQADDVAAAYVVQVFAAAFDKAGQVATEMACDRTRSFDEPCGTAPARNALSGLGSCGSEDPSVRAAIKTFRWYGNLAYAKGIDRSPTHDRIVIEALKRFPASATSHLLRAWEDGWDDAYDDVAELALERQSVLETPKVLSARTIRHHRCANSVNKD